MRRHRLLLTVALLAAAVVLPSSAAQARSAVVVAGGGALDPRFGTDGVTHTRIGDIAVATSVARQGHAIVLGGITEVDGSLDWALARYHANGSLDRSFGDRGRLRLNLAGANDELLDLAVLPDRKILAVGSGATRFVVIRLNPDGSYDRTFGHRGRVRTDFGQDYALPSCLVLLDHGRFAVAGTSTDAATGERALALARYLPSGRLDTSFGGGDGTVLRTFWGSGTEYNQPAALLRRAQTRQLVVVGTNQVAGSSTQEDVLMASFGGRGRLDRRYGGGDGWEVLSFTTQDQINGGVIYPDGSVVASGFWYDGIDTDALLVRFGPDGLLDTAWGGGDGYVRQDSGSTNESWNGMIRTGQKLVIVGQVDGAPAVRRFLVGGATDFEFGTDGLVTTAPTDPGSLRAVIRLPSGALVDAGQGQVSPTRYGFRVERRLT